MPSCSRTIHAAADATRLRRRRQPVDPHTRRAPRGRVTARLPLRGAAAARALADRGRAGRAGRDGTAVVGGRAAAHRARRRRRASGRRRGRQARCRAPGRPRAPAPSPSSTVRGARSPTLRRQGYRAAMQRLAGSMSAHASRAATPRPPGPMRRRACGRRHRPRPSSPSTTAARSACSTGSARRAGRARATSRSSATTTAPSPASPPSTSRPSARRRTRWPRLPWPLQSSGSRAIAPSRPTSSDHLIIILLSSPAAERGSGARAHDELRLDDGRGSAALGQPRSTVRTATAPRLLGAVLTHGRQADVGVCRLADVVEADDRHVVGHSQARLLARRRRSRGPQRSLKAATAVGRAQHLVRGRPLPRTRPRARSGHR